MGGYECSIIVGDRRFRKLKSRFRRLTAVLVVLFLGWYLLYIGLSAFAREFMARPVVGNVNVALVLGMLQFVSTFLLALGYSCYARWRLDPLAAQIRQEVERRREAYARMMAERRRLEDWAAAADEAAGGRLP
ncbi:DUF485 domain-containing protein [Actinocorallia sp. B10E7]|uniref:DUF485 domain-containing protein n=1 Tax=Actinocorallia sp. B10E7 TaxID=3153558 RepID=UPI00325E7E83